MEETVNQRLKILAEKLAGSVKKFSEEVKTPQQTLYAYTRGDMPGTLFYERVANRYPEVNLNWLILGRGLMFNEGTVREVLQTVPDQELVKALDRCELERDQMRQTLVARQETISLYERLLAMYERGTPAPINRLGEGLNSLLRPHINPPFITRRIIDVPTPVGP